MERGKRSLVEALNGLAQHSARWTRAANRFASPLVDLLLPISCVSCDTLLAAHEPGIVCGACWLRTDWLPQPRCDRCGHPWLKYSCRWCELLPPYVRAARSCCWVPDGPGGAIVHGLKYGGWTRLASAMAAHMGRLTWPNDVLKERSALVPVPLSVQRERSRGYNQSRLLAEALSTRWNVPVLDALERRRETKSQTQLTPGERSSNVSGAFLARISRETLAGKHIVLVDDVVTTAATLNSCAATLYEGGARIISYVTFGRARASGDRL